MKIWFLTLLLICCKAYADPQSIRIYNLNHSEVIVEKNTEEKRSIASLTKLMTAMVYLDQRNDLNEKIILIKNVSTHLPHQAFTRRDLLNAMLVKSDNAAAETLANDYPGGREAFIAAMNAKAKNLGMLDTSFEDACGLTPNNLSTASDISKMLIEAYQYVFISEVSKKKQTEVSTTFKNKIRAMSLNNTNSALLSVYENIELSKTGYTRAAGFCVAFIIRNGVEMYAVVILGSKSLKERLAVAKGIVSAHIQNY